MKLETVQTENTDSVIENENLSFDGKYLKVAISCHETVSESTRKRACVLAGKSLIAILRACLRCLLEAYP
jgi:hypothetical protein